MYNHHNPKIAKPIMNRLLSALGEKWADASYGIDCTASISREIPNYTEKDDYGNLYDDIMEIYLPNSTEYNFDKEHFNTYTVTYGYSKESQCYGTFEETIKAVKEFEKTL